jgi:hypothetical protein
MIVDNNREEGYLTLALGAQTYFDQAANLAASIRCMDPSRRICLVHDKGADIPYDIAHLFHDLVPITKDERYPVLMNKIRLHNFSPYSRTMFVDSDCLLVKQDVNHWWEVTHDHPFSITGYPKTSGEWKGLDVAKVIRDQNIPYLIQMNAGVFVFDKTPKSIEFFQGLNDFYLTQRNNLCGTTHRGIPTQTDEIYIGVYMGLLGMGTKHVANIGENSWMASTWRALRLHIKPDQGEAILYKPRGYPSPLWLLPSHWDRLSPTFAHFIGLKPRRMYESLAKKFRQKLGTL